MKYIDADKIRAEIERLYEEYKDKFHRSGDSYHLGLIDGLDMAERALDTLEAGASYDTQQYTPRPSVSIEDVARVQFASHAKVFDKKRKAVFNWEQFKDIVGIFYGFGKKDSLQQEQQKEPVSEDLEEAAEKYSDKYCSDWAYRLEYEDAFVAGAKWMAEQLKK